MQTYAKMLASMIMVVLLSGCDFNLNIGIRSGTTDDDYVEEPLGEMAGRYENALTVSNAVVEKIVQGKYQDIHDDFVQADMKSVLTTEAVKNLYTRAANVMGPIVNYKKMQWGFVPAEENGEDLLFSYKIIEHEKGILNYAFVFEDDGEYKKLVGVIIKPRNGPRKPNEL